MTEMDKEELLDIITQPGHPLWTQAYAQLVKIVEEYFRKPEQDSKRG